MAPPALSVRDLSVRYRGKDEAVHALQGLSFDLRPGQVLALVGESGSGKTTAALALLRLLPAQGEVLSGQVLFEGHDLLQASDHDLRQVRGRRAAIIFQDPVAGLNPVLSIGDQVAETLRSHVRMDRKQARQAALDLLHRVGLAEPSRVARAYPFQLSGGMCQRVMIAMATALNPAILIADEPTSSLDVTVQAQILRQMDEMRTERGTAILLITHDFGVVAHMADDVAVIYAGSIVEQGPAEQVMAKPLHPYTAALLAATPRLDGDRGPLRAIPGQSPTLAEPSPHCPFAPRCTKVVNRCRAGPPPPLASADGDPAHSVACYNTVWHWQEGAP